MTSEPFHHLVPSIEGNARLREPQVGAYAELKSHYSNPANAREASVVLPVGCGKSGLITLAPFAVAATKVLVIAPGVRIADQLLADFDVANDDVGSSRVDLQACKLEYSIVSPK